MRRTFRVTFQLTIGENQAERSFDFIDVWFELPKVVDYAEKQLRSAMWKLENVKVVSMLVEQVTEDWIP